MWVGFRLLIFSFYLALSVSLPNMPSVILIMLVCVLLFLAFLAKPQQFSFL